MVDNGRMRGVVRWFNNSKGYGFIAGSDGTDLFVHYSDIAAEGYRTLGEGEAVEFDAERGSRGLRARNVRSAWAPKAEAITPAYPEGT